MAKTLTTELHDTFSQIAVDIKSLSKKIDEIDRSAPADNGNSNPASQPLPVNPSLSQSNPVFLPDALYPVKAGYYTRDSRNRPTSHGTTISLNSNGTYQKMHDNWITTFAFGTDGRIFFSQNTNTAPTVWREIYHEGVTPTRAIQVAALQSGIATDLTQAFYKSWTKISSKTPSKGSCRNIEYDIDPKKIVNVSYRIDGPTTIVNQGLSIAFTKDYIVVENENPDPKYAQCPLTIYIEFEYE